MTSPTASPGKFVPGLEVIGETQPLASAQQTSSLVSQRPTLHGRRLSCPSFSSLASASSRSSALSLVSNTSSAAVVSFAGLGSGEGDSIRSRQLSRLKALANGIDPVVSRGQFVVDGRMLTRSPSPVSPNPTAASFGRVVVSSMSPPKLGLGSDPTRQRRLSRAETVKAEIASAADPAAVDPVFGAFPIKPGLKSSRRMSCPLPYAHQS